MAGALILLALGTEFICSSICKAFEEVIFSAGERIFLNYFRGGWLLKGFSSPTRGQIRPEQRTPDRFWLKQGA